MIPSSAIGAVIKRFRKNRHLSQDVLSGLSGLARSHLSSIESGKKKLNLETLFRIADALAVPAHVLIFEAEVDAAQAKKNIEPSAKADNNSS